MGFSPHIEKYVTWHNLDQGLKITHLLMNSKHTSFPPFDFLLPGRLKFIRLFELISSVANNFLVDCLQWWGQKQLKFFSQTDEKEIHADRVRCFHCSSIKSSCLTIDLISSGTNAYIITPLNNIHVEEMNYLKIVWTKSPEISLFILPSDPHDCSSSLPTCIYVSIIMKTLWHMK